MRTREIIYVKKKKKISNPVLPEEIVEKILSRLPLKSLLQCKSICKSWYAYIISPLCISNRRKNTPTSRHKLICANNSGLSYSLDFNDPDPNMFEIEYPKLQRLAYIKIWGSCNGIICTSAPLYGTRYTTHNLCLWNPSTREFKELTVGYEGYCKGNEARWSIYELYYNSNVQDYEIVEIISNAFIGIKIGDWSCLQTEFRIYSVNKNSWGEIGKTGVYVILKRRMGAVVQNAIHWVGNYHWDNTTNEEDPKLIIAFHIVDKQFKEIALPDYKKTGMSKLLSVAELDGSLCFSATCHGRLKIWVMKEYGNKDSWEMVFEIDKERPVGVDMPTTRPLCFAMEYAKFIAFNGFGAWFLDIMGCPLEWEGFMSPYPSTTYQERFAPLSLVCSRFKNKKIEKKAAFASPKSGPLSTSIHETSQLKNPKMEEEFVPSQTILNALEFLQECYKEVVDGC